MVVMREPAMMMIIRSLIGGIGVKVKEKECGEYEIVCEWKKCKITDQYIMA